MSELLIAVGSAFWLGILTSISPCPMATNIAAISFIGKKIDKPSGILFSGLLYTAGRTAVYLVLGILLVSTALSTPVVSDFLQSYMNLFLGPVLIFAGMVLLEMISLSFGGSGLGGFFQKKADKMGIFGAFILGVFFALSFCPTSAALFFATLIPLAATQNSSILLPAVYGIATAIPVLIFAVVLGFSANKMGNLFNKITIFEIWARKITGGIFILVGIYYTLIYIFEVQIL